MTPRKSIRLKEMTFHFFKGLKNKTIVFDEEFTNISARNESYKTTVMVGMLWLLTGKDQYDRADYEIKTINTETGETLTGVDHYVQGVFVISDDTGKSKEVTLKRLYREKWSVKTGDIEPTFDGHETKFWKNNDPCKTKKEYVEFVEENFAKLDLLQRLIDTNYFTNDKKMTVDQRRAFLVGLAGEITDDAVKDNLLRNEEFTKDHLEYLEGILAENRDYHGMLSSINTTIKDLEKQMDPIKPKIEENELALAGKTKQNEDAIKLEIIGLEDQIKNIDLAQADASKRFSDTTSAMILLRRQLSDNTIAIADIENTVRAKVKKDNEFDANELNRAISERDHETQNLTIVNNRLTNAAKTVADQKALLEKLRTDRDEVKARVFEPNEDDSKCDKCGADLENADELSEKAEAKFNEKKANDLAAIVSKGKAAKADLETYEGAIITLEASKSSTETKIAAAKAKIEELETKKKDSAISEEKLQELVNEALGQDDKYIQLTQEKIILNGKIEAATDVDGENLTKAQIEEYSNQKALLNQQIFEQRQLLAINEDIVKTKKRIEDLKQEAKDLAEKIGEQKKRKNMLQKYNFSKMEVVESRVNKMFGGGVTFRLFRPLTSGEGYEDVCVILVDNVPFGTKNNAGMINAGIAITDTLHSVYNIDAPVFVDNNESVNNVYEIEAQMITLTVSYDPEMVVSYGKSK